MSVDLDFSKTLFQYKEDAQHVMDLIAEVRALRAEVAKAWEAAAEAQREKDAKLLELAGWSKYSVQDLIRGNSLAPRPEAPK